MYRLLADWSKTMLIVAVTHDLNLALRFSDLVLVMQDGRVTALGAPQDALAPATIQSVFGVRAEFHDGWLRYDA